MAETEEDWLGVVGIGCVMELLCSGVVETGAAWLGGTTRGGEEEGTGQKFWLSYSFLLLLSTSTTLLTTYLSVDLEAKASC